jgi:hypothetical protein
VLFRTNNSARPIGPADCGTAWLDLSIESAPTNRNQCDTRPEAGTDLVERCSPLSGSGSNARSGR